MKKKDLLKIVNKYGIIPQIEYWSSELWELSDAISNHYYDEYKYFKEVDKQLKEHIAEEIADNKVMIYQIVEYYYERLEYQDVEPYEHEVSDSIEELEDIRDYIKDFQKYACRLVCEVARVEERDQDYISEYRYLRIIECVEEVLSRLDVIEHYYEIKERDINRIMKYKIERQISRIER